MTRLLHISFTTMVLGTVAYAQPSETVERKPLDLHRINPMEETWEVGDFVSPIQQALHSLDHAAYENWLIFKLNGDHISQDVLPLHRAVRRAAADREKLLVILRAAELLNNATIGRHGPELLPESFTKPVEEAIGKTGLTDSCTSTPHFFRSKVHLKEIRNQAKYMKALHRSLLLHSKAICTQRRARKVTEPDTEGFPVVSFDEEGHPADFLSMEMRETLQYMGYPINSVYGTNYHALSRPAHLDLESDQDFRQAVREKQVYEAPALFWQRQSDPPYANNDDLFYHER